MNIQHGLPPYLPENTYCAIDSEWFGINQNQLHRPTSGKFACLTLCHDPETVYFIDDPKDVPEALERIKDAVWLIHHAKFDLVQLGRLATIKPRTKLVDTMLMERIIYAGHYDRFSLEDLARRYLDIRLDKSVQKSFYGEGTTLSDIQINYAAMDTLTLLQVWNEQKKHIMQNDMYIWRNVDLPALWAIMNFEGFTLDVPAWIALAVKNGENAAIIDQGIPFNPRSPKQVTEQLRAKGFKGLKNSQEKTLQKAIRKYPNTEAARLAITILESRGLTRRASTYGLKFIEKFLETREDESQFILADYWVTGAETGRTSCSDPNMQNIPVRDTKDFRKCFIASPGNALIILDWSQQEICDAAYLSDDKALKAIVNSGQDIYILMAKEMYNEDIDKKNPLRKRMKSVVLGADYGLSEFGLADKEGIAVEEAAEILDRFFKKFPGMEKWQEHQQKIKCGYTLTAAGRRAYLNPYNSQSERNALNNPIQGTAADQMKKAIAEVDKQLLPIIKQEGRGGIVGAIHDELILDVPKQMAEAVAKAAKYIMEEVANKMCPSVKFRAEYSIGQTWADKE